MSEAVLKSLDDYLEDMSIKEIIDSMNDLVDYIIKHTNGESS